VQAELGSGAVAKRLEVTKGYSDSRAEGATQSPLGVSDGTVPALRVSDRDPNAATG
jgi:hypothetical protein